MDGPDAEQRNQLGPLNFLESNNFRLDPDSIFSEFQAEQKLVSVISYSEDHQDNQDNQANKNGCVYMVHAFRSDVQIVGFRTNVDGKVRKQMLDKRLCLIHVEQRVTKTRAQETHRVVIDYGPCVPSMASMYNVHYTDWSRWEREEKGRVRADISFTCDGARSRGGQGESKGCFHTNYFPQSALKDVLKDVECFIREYLCGWHLPLKDESLLANKSHLHMDLCHYNTIVNYKLPPLVQDSINNRIPNMKAELRRLHNVCILKNINSAWKGSTIDKWERDDYRNELRVLSGGYNGRSVETMWQNTRLWTQKKAVSEMKLALVRGRGFVNSSTAFAYCKDVDIGGGESVMTEDDVVEEMSFWEKHQDAFTLDANPMGVWPPNMSNPLKKLRLGSLKGRRDEGEYKDTWDYVPVVFQNGINFESLPLVNENVDNFVHQADRYIGCGMLKADELKAQITTGYGGGGAPGEGAPGEDTHWEWVPIYNKRDLIANRNRAEFRSAKRNEIWTMVGTLAHERLFVRAVACGRHTELVQEGDGEWLRMSREDEFVVPTDMNKKDNKIETVDTNFIKVKRGSGGGDGEYLFEASHYYGLCPDLGSLPVEGEGDRGGTIQRDLRDYAWAYTNKVSMDAIAKVYADNCWNGLVAAFNTPKVILEHFTHKDSESINEIDVRHIGGEFPVVWPFGMAQGKGYETRIDAVVLLTPKKYVYETDANGKEKRDENGKRMYVYATDNEGNKVRREEPVEYYKVDGETRGLVAIVEYKMRMELQAPDTNRGVRESDLIASAAHNFSRVLVDNSNDKLQAESNAWLFYLNTGILPTFSVVVNSTRRQLPVDDLSRSQTELRSQRKNITSASICGSHTDTDKTTPIPCCYVAIKRLDFRSQYTLSLLNNMFWRPYGVASSGKVSYADGSYVVPDLNKLLDSERSFGNPGSLPDYNLQRLMAALPRCILVKAILHACAVSHYHERHSKCVSNRAPGFGGLVQHTNYQDVMWKPDILKGRPIGAILKWNEQGYPFSDVSNVVVVATKAFYHLADRSETETLNDIGILLMSRFSGDEETLFTLIKHQRLAHPQQFSICDPLVFYVGKINEAVLWHEADPLSVLASSNHAGSALASTIFRQAELPNVIGSFDRLYPDDEPVLCRSIRRDIQRQVAELTSQFIDEINSNDTAPFRVLKNMHHTDFFMHSVVSIIYRNQALERNEFGHADREFHGWGGIAEELRGQLRDVDSDGRSRWKSHEVLLSYSGSPQRYSGLHAIPIHNDQNPVEVMRAQATHKKVSMRRALHRIVNQRLMRGLCEMYGINYQIFSQDDVSGAESIQGIMDDHLSYDAQSYDPFLFPHLSQRACWSAQALQAVTFVLDQGTRDKNMIAVAMQHIREDMCFVAAMLSRDGQHRVVTRQQQRALDGAGGEGSEWDIARRQLVDELVDIV